MMQDTARPDDPRSDGNAGYWKNQKTLIINQPPITIGALIFLVAGHRAF